MPFLPTVALPVALTSPLQTANRRFIFFPQDVVAKGLHYFFSGKFPNSSSYHLSLDFKPQGKTKVSGVETVGEHINAESWLERYDRLGVETVLG